MVEDLFSEDDVKNFFFEVVDFVYVKRKLRKVLLFFSSEGEVEVLLIKDEI